MKIQYRKNGRFNLSAKLLATTCVITSSLFAANATAKQVDYNSLGKQLDILNGIFQTSLQTQDKRTSINVKVESLYLSGQGAVFTINSSNNYAWNTHGFNFVFPDVGASTHGNREVIFFSDDEIEIQIESQQEVHEQLREVYHDMREQQREITYEFRDLERDSKDLEYQLKNIAKDEKAQVINAQKALVKQKQALEKVRQSLENKSKKMQQAQLKQQQQRLEQRKVQYQKLSTSLIETLCLYGNSLKALPSNEHVSLIVKSSGEKVGRNYKDTIYVFNKQSIRDCANDKVSVKKFATLANSYQF